jgi:methionine sulfoxide reductase catalytic subunit
MSTDEQHGGGSQAGEKNIGRRTFLGLIVVGIAALFLGKDILARITSDKSTGETTADGSSGGGKSPTAGFRINSIQQGPVFDPNAWKLTVDGLVGAPLTFTWSQFTDLPQTKLVRDFYCVEGWGVTGVEWVGVTVKELMDRAQVAAGATHLVFHSSDGVYTDSLTLEQSAVEDVLLVHKVNGVDLPRDMGQPVRLIYPGHYGYKYVKWVERVEAVDQKVTNVNGYWEDYGYSGDASLP